MGIQKTIQKSHVGICVSLAMAESVSTADQGPTMAVWTAVGVGAGVAIGVATGDIAVWTALGGAGGVAMGALQRRR
jgi:hypothetical protein